MPDRFDPVSLFRPAVLTVRRGLSQTIDAWLGVTTTDEIIAGSLGIDRAGLRRNRLRAFGWTSCWRLLRHLPCEPSDVFLDIGCGAGRMVCAAARRPYKAVIGVELRSELAARARTNVGHLRGARAPCEIVEGDATRYPVPDDVTVVFLYNPFVGAPLQAVVDNLAASYRRRPRTITVAYANPVEPRPFDTWTDLLPRGPLQLAWRPGGEWRRSLTVQIYRTDGVAARSLVAAPDR